MNKFVVIYQHTNSARLSLYKRFWKSGGMTHNKILIMEAELFSRGLLSCTEGFRFEALKSTLTLLPLLQLSCVSPGSLWGNQNLDQTGWYIQNSITLDLWFTYVENKILWQYGHVERMGETDGW